MSRETSLSQTTHISSMLEYPAERTTDKLLGLSLRARVQIITVTGLAIPVAVPRARHLGMVLMFEVLIVFVYGIFPGYNDYVKDLGMVITLFGVATLLCGWDVMKVAWFPIVFLVVALPWPELVYAKLAWPLQKLAASVAVGTLRIFGVDAQNTGTRI